MRRQNRASAYQDVRKGGFLLLIFVGLALVGLVWFRHHSRSLIKWLDRTLGRWRFVPERLRRLVTHLFEQLAQALGIFTDIRELAATVFWTLLLWMDVLATTWLVMKAFGLSPGLRDAMFIMGWALVGSLFPGPGGGAGGFHATTKYGLTMFLGVEANQAAALTIIMHLVYFAPALLFGVYYFLRSDISTQRLRQLASSEAVEHAVEDETIEIPGVSENLAEEILPVETK